ncbi:MAG: hypothetical protein COA32_02970 [Fluviicola sp.]|nr:MAG: hypothetical protein COA32_02970 [Fluviicola sp.]
MFGCGKAMQVYFINDAQTWKSLSFPTLGAEWAHIATVADANGMYIYYDGQLVADNADGATTILDNAGSLLDLGQDIRYPSETLNRNSNSSFDNFHVWSSARTAAENQNNLENCMTGTETGLELYIEFSEGTETQISSVLG